MCLSCERPIAEEILDYLAAHPNAQDTLEGIVEWWLLEQQIKCGAASVREAVAKLVADGLLIGRQSEGLPASYRLNTLKSKKGSRPSSKGRRRRSRRSE